MSQIPIEISLELTPNPNTLKYALNRRILAAGSQNYTTAEDAAAYSPLASKLFALEGIGGVMIGPSFVTITLLKTDKLRDLNRQVMATLKAHLESGEEICRPREPLAAGEEDAVSTRIREIIDGEIRPAVAMDGGDITFKGFKEGTVYLHMQGACSGCPSSTATLKSGIENLLRHFVPGVEAVQQV